MMSPDELAERYYAQLAVAFVRGRLGSLPGLSPEQVFEAGQRAGLRVHAFKRTATLPRVRRVLGILRGMAPTSLVDVGSGRGTFLWPLLDACPELRVTAIDRDPRRAEALDAVRRGGATRLTAALMDAERLDLPDGSAGGVTLLEVLEHVRRPKRAAAEALRVARRFAVVSVPSKEDENPEHIRVFDRRSLEDLLRSAGARKVSVDYVPNHMIALARV